MSHKKDYFDLQAAGGKVLRKIAYQIIGSEYVFKSELSEALQRPPYSITRYLEHLTRELLMDNYDKLEQAIQNVLNKCSEGTITGEINPKKVMRQRELLEEKLMQELRKLHEEAVARYIG